MFLINYFPCNFHLLIVITGIKFAWNIVTGDVISTIKMKLIFPMDKCTAKGKNTMPH